MSDPKRKHERETPKDWASAVAVIVGLAVCVAVAVWYFAYDSPGAPPTVGGFVILFFREAVLLVVLVVALALFLWRKLRRSTTATSRFNGDERGS